MKKAFISFILIVSALLSLLSLNVVADDSLKIYVNEQVLQCDVAPFIQNGRTMVPMRKIFEALNAKVDWNGNTQTITATKDNTEIILRINNNTIYNNGVAEILDVAPIIVNDSTFVPIRAISQSLNAEVEWLENTHSVYINSPIEYGIGFDSYMDYVMNIQAFPETESNNDQTTESIITMYAPDGRTIEVLQSEVESYQNVGWYLMPVTTMYAPDGRTIVVPQDEVNDYLNVGWYQTYNEAKDANTPSYSTSNNNNNSNNNDNHPNSGGRTVYRTPSGSRYHFDPDCGGKNSYQTTLEGAKRAGLTPCKKCAW